MLAVTAGRVAIPTGLLMLSSGSLEESTGVLIEKRVSERLSHGSDGRGGGSCVGDENRRTPLQKRRVYVLDSRRVGSTMTSMLRKLE